MRTRVLMISVVDDEEAIRKALCRLLRAAGFQVAPHASGQEFLDSLTRQIPDCVISDFTLPDLSGQQIQQELGRRNPNIPVIVITGSEDPEIAERLLASGVAAVLLKPVENHKLLQTIAAVTQSAEVPDPASRPASIGS